jgi:hypothetical protein
MDQPKKATTVWKRGPRPGFDRLSPNGGDDLDAKRPAGNMNKALVAMIFDNSDPGFDKLSPNVWG